MRPKGARPLIFGHRGASAVAPENTVAAIMAARDAGADGVEVDAQLTQDGAVVIFHDRGLARLTGDRRRVGRVNLATLRVLRVDGEPIPTLTEALEACGDLLFNLEIKDESPLGNRVLITRVAEALRSARRQERCIVSSFNRAALGAFQQIAPEFPTGLLLDRRSFERALRWAGSVGRRVRPVAVHPPASLCTADRIERWHGQGYRVVAWTVDDVEQALGLAAMGVDAILTNDPARLIAAFRR